MFQYEKDTDIYLLIKKNILLIYIKHLHGVKCKLWKSLFLIKLKSEYNRY